jgi:opacity protein-like surface antigen
MMKGLTMPRLTTLRLAGIAAVLSAGSAFAADMIGHPPPPPLAPPPAHVDVGSGFYLRGDVGVGLYDHGRIDTVPFLPGLTTRDSSLNGTAFIGIGAGYQFNSFLRADITGEYRFHTKHRHVDNYPAGPGYGAGANLITGKVGGFVGLANAYVDLGTWHRITPFIGAGIGFASLSMTNTQDMNLLNNAVATAPNKTQTRLAWAIHAGLGYDLTANLKAEVAYRYLHIGNVTSGTVACGGGCDFAVRIKDLQSHDLKVGLRYVFADAPVYAPGPLMRKY